MAQLTIEEARKIYASSDSMKSMVLTKFSKEDLERHEVTQEEDTKILNLRKLNDLLQVQGHDGNWNYDEYMRGMYNGMELSVAIMEHRDPKYR